MYRRLATLTAKTGLTTGIVVLLTLGTLLPGAAGAPAENCPVGTAPIVDGEGNPQCVALAPEGTTPEPTPPPTASPTPTPTSPPTPPPTALPPSSDNPATAPTEEPVPSAVPESSPAVTEPPPEAEPAQPQTPTAPTPDPSTRSVTPADQTDTSTPTPAVVPPEPPANAGQTGVIGPGDGPRLLWAVAAGASATGLLAALLAFYLVSVRPFITARRRPGALG